MTWSSKWSLNLRFPHQNHVHASLLSIRTKCPVHLILLDYVTRTTVGEQYRSLSSTPYSQTPSAYVPSSKWATKFRTHTKQQANL
jgi:hypothetical protein